MVIAANRYTGFEHQRTTGSGCLIPSAFVSVQKFVLTPVQLLQGAYPYPGTYQWDLYWTVRPEANQAALLGLNPLRLVLDVQEMATDLELEPFEFFRFPCQGMPLHGAVCVSKVAASVRCLIENRLPHCPQEGGGGHTRSAIPLGPLGFPTQKSTIFTFEMEVDKSTKLTVRTNQKHDLKMKHLGNMT